MKISIDRIVIRRKYAIVEIENAQESPPVLFPLVGRHGGNGKTNRYPL